MNLSQSRQAFWVLTDITHGLLTRTYWFVLRLCICLCLQISGIRRQLLMQRSHPILHGGIDLLANFD